MNDNEGEAVLQYINNKQFLLEESQDLLLEFLSNEAFQKLLNQVGEFRARIYSPLKTIHMGIQ